MAWLTARDYRSCIPKIQNKSQCHKPEYRFIIIYLINLMYIPHHLAVITTLGGLKNHRSILRMYPRILRTEWEGDRWISAKVCKLRPRNHKCATERKLKHASYVMMNKKYRLLQLIMQEKVSRWNSLCKLRNVCDDISGDRTRSPKHQESQKFSPTPSFKSVWLFATSFNWFPVRCSG